MYVLHLRHDATTISARLSKQRTTQNIRQSDAQTENKIKISKVQHLIIFFGFQNINYSLLKTEQLKETNV
jgi:hypothetical protein